MPERPSLVTSPPPGPVRVAVLIAHGGREIGTAPPSGLAPGLLRMLPFARELRRTGARGGLLVAQLRYRMAGYNDGSPVEDVSWAIQQVNRLHGVPICLVGHSMGSRAVLQAAGGDGVVGVVALAPWCPPTDPVEQLAGRMVMFVHGVNDHVTSPSRSHEYAIRARNVTAQLCRFEVARSGHRMLLRAGLWYALTTGFVLGRLGIRLMPTRITDAIALPTESACAVPL